ncbi:hypothetical protein D0817_24250 [Flavobacterium cupreum]|uniref:Uncharacterized protein n=1 Tax=Flavobacterium cupreum TaxID=2133766 RepID=A0A434A0F5_9FLAO|nr:hypothetical protein [Flavobacterium cupreum]RUT67853.1 hypothetical protein D0817_24250 [Flavobacterium cupreum]
MKKNKTAFDTRFWAGFTAENPFKVLDAFFDFADLDDYKQQLNEALRYSGSSKVYEQDNPASVFVFYTVVSSFLKACYCLREKSKKWKVKASLPSETVSQLSSLTKEEYENPFSVFQKAFNEKTPEEFEFFLREIVRLSLSPQAEDADTDLTIYYIHVIKMLDAAELMRERGVEKSRKRNQMAPVTA